jgi:hypothetical protein
MKKALSIAGALCLAAILFAGAALAAGPGGTPAVIESTIAAEPLPVNVVTSANRLEICKIYELSPSVDPGLLPRGSFERAGYLYECVDILREVVIGEEYKIVAVSETVESAKNDADSVLGLLPQYREYADEEGFSGNLLLDTAAIKSEVAGYGSYSTPYSVSRSYPNLSGADTQHIPKTIEDGGRTLQLQDVEWRADNTYNADDYEIGDRYTAIATYGGTRTSSYVTGYIITADYAGEAMRKGVTVIRYTVIFSGKAIPEPEPEPTPGQPMPTPDATPAPEAEPSPAQEEQPAPVRSAAGCWLPILLSALALLGSGACAYVTIKNIRKEPPRHEKEIHYDYPGPGYFPDGADVDPGAGD